MQKTTSIQKDIPRRKQMADPHSWHWFDCDWRFFADIMHSRLGVAFPDWHCAYSHRHLFTEIINKEASLWQTFVLYVYALQDRFAVFFVCWSTSKNKEKHRSAFDRCFFLYSTTLMRSKALFSLASITA